LAAPKLFDHEDGSGLGLNIPLFDAVNGFLSQADLLGKLILAQPQHRPCGSQLGGERSPINTQHPVEL